jgi:hypothetical protein
MIALIAGGWREAKPYCWIPTKNGYLCWHTPGIVPTLGEAQERVREHEALVERMELNVPIPMTAARRAFHDPLEVTLDEHPGLVEA